LSQPSSAVSGLWKLTMLRPRTWASEMGAGWFCRKGGAGRFWKFQQKRSFLIFEWENANFATFDLP